MRLIEELKGWTERGYDPLANIAVVYAGLGQNDEAMQWLERVPGSQRRLIYVALKADLAGTLFAPM
jgi:hypothetical protein